MALANEGVIFVSGQYWLALFAVTGISPMVSTIAQKIRNVGRLTQVVNIFARYGFKKELQRTELGDLLSTTPSSPVAQDISASGEGSIAGGGNIGSSFAGAPEPKGDEATGARRLAQAFEELGPTFVKLGQLLASREDLLPKHYITELKRLQDAAKPFSAEALEKILTTEFKGRHKEIFSSIDPVPLGAASIGQVHLATLANGCQVVLKIQRPEVENLIRTDLSILMGVASILESAIPELKLLRPTIVIEELKKSLHAELDYFREAANTERMRTLFEGHEKIYIPEVFREYSTRRVLCMEAINGTKLTQLERNENNQEIVRWGVQAFLDMTFKFGMFHADLHPGNFILMSNERLAILDFGLTARLTREMRNTMSFMFLSLVNEDLESFARLFIELTEASSDCDRGALEHEIREAVDSSLSVPMRELQIGKLLMQVARIAASRNAPVSRDLVLFFRALIALESFGKSLDPRFQVLKEAADYARSLPSAGIINRVFFEQESMLLMRDSQALLKELPLTMRLLAKRLQSGHFSIRVNSEEMTVLSREIDRASNRLSLALLLGAMVLGSSIITYGKEGRLFDSLATMGLFGFGIAAFIGIWLVFSILRSGRFK